MATILTANKGDLVQIKGTFANASGNAQDPDIIWGALVDPDGERTQYKYGDDPEVVKLGTGVYAFNASMDIAGTYWGQISASGTGQGANETYVHVRQSRF